MPQVQVSAVAGQMSRVVVHDFSRGDRIVRAPRLGRATENDVLARALWLEKHGRSEEAEEFLEAWADRN